MPSRIPTALWIALLFVALSLAFIRKTGIHYDASEELAAFYSCATPVYKVSLFGRSLPVMIIPYLGALKTWLFVPILRYLGVTPVTLRIPFVLAGAASVWLFFAILQRVSGRRAAIAGSLLLATDAVFVIATTYDFGPIALLHFFLLAGVFLLLRFEASGKNRYLAAAFFLFGLALWHKALFLWMLGAFGAAVLVVVPRRMVALLSPPRVLTAGASLLLGALPLVCYNVVTDGATLRTGAVLSGKAPLSQKLLVLRKTLDSSVMFGWLTEDEQPATVIPAAHPIGKASVALSRLVGGMRSNCILYGTLAACSLLPWLWFTPARRPALFGLIYIAVGWIQMAAVPNAGATLHHAILLWPAPHFLIAVALAEVSRGLGRYGKPALAGLLIAMVGWNLLVVNQYYADLMTRGTTALWTDALYPLFASVNARNGSTIVIVDWGYAATLCLFSHGQMPLDDISFMLLQGPTQTETEWIRSLMADPATAFVDYAAGGGQFPGVRQRLQQIADEGGYTKETLDVIADRNHRARFEISRYAPRRP